MIFDAYAKQRTNDSISDNSDQEINNGFKQYFNYRKKPAPRPPNSFSPDSVNNFESISTSGVDSTSSKFRSKIGSLRSKTHKHPNNEHVKNHFDQPQSVDTSTIVTSTPVATIRRINFSPLVVNSKVKRPISIHERPGVPPPGIPPRPSASKVPNESIFESMNDSKSINDDNEENFSHSEENLDTNDENSISSIYPSLSGFQNSDNQDSPFTYPFSEFIDEIHPNMNSINDNLDNVSDRDSIKSCSNSSPPQKPPRSSLSTNSNSCELAPEHQQQNQPKVTRLDQSPPPLPLRPSKSPSPNPTVIQSVTSSNSTMMQTEKTYL